MSNSNLSNIMSVLNIMRIKRNEQIRNMTGGNPVNIARLGETQMVVTNGQVGHVYYIFYQCDISDHVRVTTNKGTEDIASVQDFLDVIVNSLNYSVPAYGIVEAVIEHLYELVEMLDDEEVSLYFHRRMNVIETIALASGTVRTNNDKTGYATNLSSVTWGKSPDYVVDLDAFSHPNYQTIGESSSLDKRLPEDFEDTAPEANTNTPLKAEVEHEWLKNEPQTDFSNFGQSDGIKPSDSDCEAAISSLDESIEPHTDLDIASMHAHIPFPTLHTTDKPIMESDEKINYLAGREDNEVSGDFDDPNDDIINAVKNIVKMDVIDVHEIVAGTMVSHPVVKLLIDFNNKTKRGVSNNLVGLNIDLEDTLNALIKDSNADVVIKTFSESITLEYLLSQRGLPITTESVNVYALNKLTDYIKTLFDTRLLNPFAKDAVSINILSEPDNWVKVTKFDELAAELVKSFNKDNTNCSMGKFTSAALTAIDRVILCDDSLLRRVLTEHLSDINFKPAAGKTHRVMVSSDKKKMLITYAVPGGTNYMVKIIHFENSKVSLLGFIANENEEGDLSLSTFSTFSATRQYELPETLMKIAVLCGYPVYNDN